jgi:hypothetical protein
MVQKVFVDHNAKLKNERSTAGFRIIVVGGFRTQGRVDLFGAQFIQGSVQGIDNESSDKPPKTKFPAIYPPFAPAVMGMLCASQPSW